MGRVLPKGVKIIKLFKLTSMVAISKTNQNKLYIIREGSEQIPILNELLPQPIIGI